MTDMEFLVIDELYFIKNFENLLDDCKILKDELKLVLQNLYHKGWIKIYKNESETIELQHIDINQIENYVYIASKKALLYHNGLI